MGEPMTVLGEEPREPAQPGAPAASFFRRARREPLVPAQGLAAGKVVGDFRLVSMIGLGGMGQVWEAEQLSLGRRRVALKFVRPDRVSERQLELFAREARASGRLHHHGIVTVHAHGTSDGLAWIAMEFVEGAWTLEDFLKDIGRSGVVPPGYDEHVAHLVAEIADALQAAHDVNVIHRDIKPQNVLITPDDRPKVSDFGLARITDEAALSLTGELAGTYCYMSPEQVLARRIGLDHRTDIFSLGVVLYELLALQRPFQGDTEHQVAEQIVAKDPPDPRTFRSRVPRDLAVIVGKALEKDRDRRFESMRALADDLRRFLAHEPIRSRPPSTVDRARKWIRRNPTRSTAATITALAFVTISALLVETRRARDELAESNRALSAKTAESEARRVATERNEQRALAGERQAAEQSARADREAEAARRRADEVLRLSALQRLDDLASAAERLWPAHPENLVRYEDWLQEASALIAELPDHRAKLAELRARVSPAEAALASQAALPVADARDRWWYNQLEKLVAGLTAFADPETGLASTGIAPGHGWGVARRADFALEIEERSLAGPDVAARWARACASIANIAECPAYAGLRLAPKLGLVPLWQDPRSGLWEFAHLQTGEPAERGPDGQPALRAETGIVFVLLPGGTFTMGAQAVDAGGANHDPEAQPSDGPVRAVTVAPFFLAKYELTQGQWLRLTGENPSEHGPSDYSPSWNRRNEPGDLLHPVERVSWNEASRVLARAGLVLPDEAQWEYGARGGTTSVWWCGNERSALARAGNLADRFAKEHGSIAWNVWEDWDDGETSHARVGSFAPNPFGLHDTIGNVYEMCQDLFAPGAPERVARGGSFGFPASAARSAHRGLNAPDDQDVNLGLRPACALAP